jgi:hypothetical protein
MAKYHVRFLLQGLHSPVQKSIVHAEVTLSDIETTDIGCIARSRRNIYRRLVSVLDVIYKCCREIYAWKLGSNMKLSESRAGPGYKESSMYLGPTPKYEPGFSRHIHVRSSSQSPRTCSALQNTPHHYLGTPNASNSTTKYS